jgi:erythromycin esterase
MSSSPAMPSTPSSDPFEVSSWNVADTERGPLDDLPPDVVVIGLGESAHFVADLNALRAQLVTRLINRRAVTHLALEVGADEAPAIQSWLDGDDVTPLRQLVGPLTYLLYGTFLEQLREARRPGVRLSVLGVDLPNSLTLEPSLAPLATLLEKLDPDSEPLTSRARALARGVVGSSAAASALSWGRMGRRAQDDITVTLARLSARVDAVGSARGEAGLRGDWRRASTLAHAAVTTDLMLRAMAELFAGEGVPSDTSLRDRFIADRLIEAVEALPPGGRIAYVAHDNHVQKTPVVFDGVLTAYPAGLFLHRALGRRYVGVALTHVDTEVPEMVVGAPNSVGFRVERTAAAPIEAGSIEAAAADAVHGGIAVVRPSALASPATNVMLRSQSAVAQVTSGSFDLTLVTPRARTDAAIDVLT